MIGAVNTVGAGFGSTSVDDGRSRRLADLQFELAFGGRSDDERLATFRRHAAGARSEQERTAMFAATYEVLSWPGKANLTRFFGGQQPVRIPELDARITRAFAGRTPPAYEVTLPFHGQRSKGVILAIHGGAWMFVGPGLLRQMDGDVNRWNERGWTVVNVTYRAGAASVDDVLAFHDAVRAWQPNARIGTTGHSAGGHLALMVAARRPDLDFVVAQGAPTDLTRMDVGTAKTRHIQQEVDKLWPDVRQRRRDSPALQSARMGAKILIGIAANDELVPPAHMEYLRAARPDLVRTFAVQPGTDIGFIHAGVSRASLDAFYARELLVAQGR